MTTTPTRGLVGAPQAMPGWSIKGYSATDQYTATFFEHPRCTAYSKRDRVTWCFYGPDAEARARAFELNLDPGRVVRSAYPTLTATGAVKRWAVRTEGAVL